MNLNFPWLKSYPEGVAYEIDSKRYSSILELFEESIAKYGDMVAYINMGRQMTFNELDEQSRNFAAFLQKKVHLKPGDRVAIQMPNLLQAPVALFGIIR